MKAETGPYRRCPDVSPLTDQLVADSINVSLERLTALKTNRSLSNSDICAMPDKALERAFARLDKPKADHPGEWAEFRNMQRQSEDGKVKPDGLIKGIQKRKELLKEFAVKASAASVAGMEYVPPAAGLESNLWTPLGPGNIGGRIRAIAIHPTDSSKIWLGSVAGGIWHSSDGGVSWNPVNDFMGNLSISSLIIDPNNPNVMYAGTGEGFYNADAVRGYGVFKSTDGGVTWNHLSSTTPSSNINDAAYKWFYVNRLAMSADGATILAATRGNSIISGAIYRSTDGGATWAQNYFGGRVLDVRFDPNDPNKAVASSIVYNLTTDEFESNIIRSTDRGQSWNTVKAFTSDGFSSRVELVYAKSNSQILYASRDNAASSSGEIWKSADGGANWSLVSTPQHLGSQGWYDNTIWVDPTNASHLVIGGLDLFRSTDGGVNWTKISNWVNNMYGLPPSYSSPMPDIPHADHHALVADPGYNGTTNKKLFNGNDGGIFRANDISVATETSGWETLNNGLSITQFYSGAGRTAAGGRIIGGTQDNGSLLRPSAGGNWQFFYGGDGGYSAVDSQNDNYLYGEYVRLQIHRSTDGGATSASYIYNGISDADTNNANFIAPFILDPNDSNRMLAGGASLWQSLAVKSPPPVNWTSIKASPGSNISAIAVAEGNSGIAWVGHNNGGVYRTSNSLDATPAWTQVGSGVLPGRMVNRILIDKVNPNKVYVAYGGYNADNLYRTTDNGASWTNITGNLPAVPIFAIARHPANANWLYAGTEVGLFTSEDGGTTWFTANDGPANVEISELSWMDSNTLLAATHGRGMFRVTINSGPDTTPPNVSSTLPADGANGVTVNTPVKAIFNEDMNAATINAMTFTLDNGVTGTVSYDSATNTATFTPSAGLAANTTYTATITTGVTDLAGNPMAVAKTWSFTTSANVTLFSDGFEGTGWSTAQVSGTAGAWTMVGSSGTYYPTASPHSGSYLAKFNSYSALSGNNTRLYRTTGFQIPGSYDTTTLSFWMYHDTGYIYSDDKVQVQVSTDGSNWSNVGATVSRYNGTTGWAQVNVDLSPYKGQSNVQIGFVGISAYGNDSYLDDVSVAASDTMPPTVSTTSPANGATGVAITGAVTATFSEAINPATISTSTFTLDNGVTGTVNYDALIRMATFTPSAALAYNTTYTATITTAVKDLAGNAMAAAKTWSFTTGGPPQHTLSATLAGSGAGSVTSTPSGLSCSAGTCPAEFDAGSQVTLTANPGVDSVFAGWSGACGGTGNCTVTMDADKSVTATFNTASMVKIGGSSYATLQGAYDGALAGDVIQTRAVDFTENLTFNRNVAVTLKGGYDGSFAANSGLTTLHGVLTVGNGTLSVENLAVR